MNAIPVSRPDGSLAGYACSSCGNVHAVNPGAGYALQRANHCCACSQCGSPRQAVAGTVRVICRECDRRYQWGVIWEKIGRRVFWTQVCKLDLENEIKKVVEEELNS